MKPIKSLLLLAISTSALGSSQGAGDIASVEKREDGLYDVTCSYNKLEKGVSRADILAGRVCHAVEGLKEVSVKGMNFAGGCSTQNYEIEDGVVDSELWLMGIRLTSKDAFVGCTAQISFKLPAGYKIGLQKFQLGVVTKGLVEGDAVDIRLSAGNEGTAASHTADSDIDAKLNFDLPKTVFSRCAKEGSRKQSIEIDFLLLPKKGKIAGTTIVNSAKLLSAALERCDS